MRVVTFGVGDDVFDARDKFTGGTHAGQRGTGRAGIGTSVFEVLCASFFDFGDGAHRYPSTG
ncbi:MAG: hypothetical protein ACRYFU_26610 [Janthinobacterium lividum]